MHHESEWGPRPARERGDEVHILGKKIEPFCPFLDGLIFAGHHQPLKVWVLCLYFMGLNVSNDQMAQELALHGSDVQQRTTQLCGGIVKKSPP